jgi:predicted Zn-dependent peptidase
MSYKIHPYQWATIGKSITHIEEASINDVKSFYNKYYTPNNAILTIVGDVDSDQIHERIANWYGDIPIKNEVSVRDYPREIFSESNNAATLERNVPQEAIHIAWLMCERNDPNYYRFDLLSDVLGNGRSSRLYTELVLRNKVFTEVSAYITGSIDQGLFVISGMLREGINHEQAKGAILDEVSKLSENPPSQRELEKVKNKLLAQKAYSEIGALAKAMNLGYYEMIGDASAVNTFQQAYLQVKSEDIQKTAKEILSRGMNILKYQKQNG